MKKEIFIITGMSCAACSARVEKAAKSVLGVLNVSVNLLTERMTVEGDFNAENVILEVKKAGYGAFLQDEQVKKAESDNAAKQFSNLKLRLIFSAVLLIFLIYISSGINMFGLGFFGLEKQNFLILAILQLILALSVLIINKKFFISGVKAALSLFANMDTLVSLGSLSAFCYSLVVLISMVGKDVSYQKAAFAGLYFETAAMIPTLITVGKMLEGYSKAKTTRAIGDLVKLRPETARKIVGEDEVIVPASEIAVGDVFALKAGDLVPVDGQIISGDGVFFEAAISGESMPSDKTVGDDVISGTAITSGYVRVRAQKVGEDTVISQIIKLVGEASSSKAKVSRIADKAASVFVPFVMAISLITFVSWIAVNGDIGFALARAISVLVISCPCALGLATPVAIMVSSGVGAENGILFKSAAAIESLAKIKILCLDKTGTVTEGKPQICDILCPENYDENTFISLCAGAEQKSSHPLGKAVVEYAKTQNIPVLPSADFESANGRGIEATVDNKTVSSLSFDAFCRKYTPNEMFISKANEYLSQGKTPLCFAVDNKSFGIISVSDVAKADSFEAIEKIKALGISVVMLTGDNKVCAEVIAKDVGIEKVFASLMPTQKADIISALKKDGSVCMVGDGINDAPSLAMADVGIAVGGAADIAGDSADIVLSRNDIMSVYNAVILGKKTLKNIKENLFWAFFYNAIGIPVAAGVFVRSLGLTLSPVIGAAAMSLSSVFVVCNALRLNFIKFNKKRKAEKMTKTYKIEGMMCTHCSSRVKAALEATAGVLSADVSHQRGDAIVTFSRDIDDKIIIKAITDAGYKASKLD